MPARHHGFTLVELLVVVSIISLLSSITLASLETAKEKARWAVTKQNLATIFDSMYLCIDGGGVPMKDIGQVCRLRGDAVPRSGGVPLCSNDPSLGNWPAIGLKQSTTAFFECDYDPSVINYPYGYSVSLFTGYCQMQCGVDIPGCRLVPGSQPCPY